MVYYSDFEKNGNNSQLAEVYSNGKTIYNKLLRINLRGLNNDAILKKNQQTVIATVQQFSVNC